MMNVLTAVCNWTHLSYNHQMNRVNSRNYTALMRALSTILLLLLSLLNVFVNGPICRHDMTNRDDDKKTWLTDKRHVDSIHDQNTSTHNRCRDRYCQEPKCCHAVWLSAAANETWLMATCKTRNWSQCAANETFAVNTLGQQIAR